MLSTNAQEVLMSQSVKETILIIEDEEDIQELVRYNLSKEGYTVFIAKTGEQGLTLALQHQPDLIILDLMLPGIDGLDVCKSLKGNVQTSNTPIIMVSAKGEESDIVTGLELGADDYVTKPFSPRILNARVKVALRKESTPLVDEKSLLTAHDLTIDPIRFEIRSPNRIILLTVTEFKIFHYLARHPGWVFTRYQIVDAVKGEDYAVTDRSVDVQIVGLRKKLGEYGDYIETVRGVGYRFKD